MNQPLLAALSGHEDRVQRLLQRMRSEGRLSVNLRNTEDYHTVTTAIMAAYDQHPGRIRLERDYLSFIQWPDNKTPEGTYLFEWSRHIQALKRFKTKPPLVWAFGQANAPWLTELDFRVFFHLIKGIPQRPQTEQCPNPFTFDDNEPIQIMNTGNHWMLSIDNQQLNLSEQQRESICGHFFKTKPPYKEQKELSRMLKTSGHYDSAYLWTNKARSWSSIDHNIQLKTKGQQGVHASFPSHQAKLAGEYAVYYFLRHTSCISYEVLRQALDDNNIDKIIRFSGNKEFITGAKQALATHLRQMPQHNHTVSSHSLFSSSDTPPTHALSSSP